METIAGIELFPLISLIIFVVFFVGLTIYVITIKKSRINELSNLPLDPKEEDYESA